VYRLFRRWVIVVKSDTLLVVVCGNDIQEYSFIYIHTHIRAHIHPGSHVQMQKHIRTPRLHTHTYSERRTHTRTHTHTLLCRCPVCWYSGLSSSHRVFRCSGPSPYLWGLFLELHRSSGARGIWFLRQRYSLHPAPSVSADARRHSIPHRSDEHARPAQVQGQLAPAEVGGAYCALSSFRPGSPSTK